MTNEYFISCCLLSQLSPRRSILITVEGLLVKEAASNKFDRGSFASTYLESRFQKSANLSCLLLTLFILELGTMDTSASSFVNYLSKLLTSSKLLELKLGLAGAGNSFRSIAS